MPLVGLECCDGQLRTLEECLAHARDHHCSWTEVILSAIVANIRPSRETPSITELLNCRRKTVLERRLDYYGRPESLYWMLRGTALHQIIAMTRP